VPLEAVRLGLPTFASDLNPVAVLLTRALADLPGRFATAPRIGPEAQGSLNREHGLANTLRYYGGLIRERALHRLARLYPSFRGDRVRAWLWVRTVECPNPGCRVEAPLANKFSILSRGEKVWVEPRREGRRFLYALAGGTGEAPPGTVSRAGARCLACNALIPFAHIRAEGIRGKLGANLIALALEGTRRFAEADLEQERIALSAQPAWTPESELPERALEILRGAPGLQLAGLLSHFGDADDPASPRNPAQEERFAGVLALVGRRADIGPLLVVGAVLAALGFSLPRLYLQYRSWVRARQIERGLRNPTLDVVERFAKALRVKPLDLLQ